MYRGNVLTRAVAVFIVYIIYTFFTLKLVFNEKLFNEEDIDTVYVNELISVTTQFFVFVACIFWSICLFISFFVKKGINKYNLQNDAELKRLETMVMFFVLGCTIDIIIPRTVVLFLFTLYIGDIVYTSTFNKKTTKVNPNVEDQVKYSPPQTIV